MVKTMIPDQAKLSRRRVLSRGVLGLALLAVRPERASAADRQIVDVLGRTISMTRPAERVVVAFYADEFGAIAGPGGWDRVAGLSKRQWAVNRTRIWDKYKAAVPRLDRIEDVGADEDKSFSVEKVLSLRPDLLIVPAWFLNERGQLLDPVHAAGIPVVAVDYNSQDPARHVSSTIAIGMAIGAEERANRLATLYRDKVAGITALAARAGRRPKVYVEIGMNGPEVFGNTYRNTMWGKMVDLIGAENIANGAIPAGFAPMAPEQVLAARPDFVFITGSSWANQPRAVRLGYDVDPESARASLRQYLSRPGWSELPAVKAGNVFTIEHTLTRSLMDWISMQYIAKQLYPEQFADVDPEQSLRDYHAEFLPVAYSGTWMTRLT